MEETIKIVEKAEKDAKRIINGNTNPDDLELLFRIKIANRLSIGIFDNYFQNLNIYQLAFEAHLYTAQDKIRNMTEIEKQEEEAKKLEKQISDKKIILPPGYEELSNQGDDEIFSIKQGDSFNGNI